MKMIRYRKGFSLAETLVALLIVLLAASVVAAGMPAAKDAYYKVQESANAQVFLSTTLTALRKELSTATNIQVDSDKKLLKYDNPVTGESVISFDKVEGKVEGKFMIRTYLDLDSSDGNKARPLVPDSVRTDSLWITTSPSTDPPTITFDKGTNSFTITKFAIESRVTRTVVAELEQDYTVYAIVPSDVIVPSS